MKHKLIPEHCAMPDISRRFAPQFRTLTHLLLLANIENDESLSEKAHKLRRTIIRLIDKANREYMGARQHMIKQLEESNRPLEQLTQGRIIYMFGFIDEIENCVITCRRLLDLLEEIGSDPSASENSKIQEVLDPRVKKM